MRLLDNSSKQLQPVANVENIYINGDFMNVQSARERFDSNSISTIEVSNQEFPFLHGNRCVTAFLSVDVPKIWRRHNSGIFAYDVPTSCDIVMHTVRM